LTGYGGRERDAVIGLAGTNGDADRGVRLAGAVRDEEHDIGTLGDEIEGAEVGDDVSLQRALEAEVEVLERLSRWEPGGADAALAAVVLAGGNFTLQARGEELFMRPALGPCPLRESFDCMGERRCFQSPAQVGDVGRRLGCLCRCGHHATPRARS
jgi:hypothetical protein